MRTALFAAMFLAATGVAQAGQYWEVEETTLVRMKPTQYEDDVYYGEVAPAAGPVGPRFRWGSQGRWQGAHVGITASRNTGKTTYTNPSNASDTFKDNTNVGAGAQLGYTVQRGALVVGVEGDASTGGSKGDDHFSLGQQDIVKSKWNASARGRVGVDVGGVLLPYATAGWAWQSVDYTIYDDYLPATSKHSEVISGPTYGGGVEMALSDQTSIRGEYRRTNFDASQFDAPATYTDRKFDREMDTVTFSLNYRFPNPPAR